MKKLFLWHLGALGLLIAILAAFDMNLNLGKFHGFVFTLYLAYGGVLFFLADEFTALVFLIQKQKEKAKKWSLFGLVFGLFCFGIAYGSSLLPFWN